MSEPPTQHHGQAEPFSKPLQQIQPEEYLFGFLFKGKSHLAFFVAVIVFWFSFSKICKINMSYIDFFSASFSDHQNHLENVLNQQMLIVFTVLVLIYQVPFHISC